MTTTFRAFAKSTTKIAVAIFLALLAVALLGALGTWAVTAFQAQQAKPYEEVREWDVDLTENLKLTLKARTKVISSRLLTSIRILGYPNYLSLQTNENVGFTLHFLDKDGFKVHSKSLKLQEFSSVVGADGKKIGLTAQIEDYLDIDSYKRFEKLTVEWTLETESPKEPNARPDPVLLDHCAPNLTKAERLKRLAQHGSVRETGDGSYSAGTKSIHFFYDGTLLNCR